MYKLAITLLTVPTFLMLGAPSTTLKHNPEPQSPLTVPAAHSSLAAMSHQAEPFRPSYEISLSARAHAVNHHMVSSRVVAMVSPY